SEGEHERIEFTQPTTFPNGLPGVVGEDSTSQIPVGMPTWNHGLDYRSSFYWDKRAYEEAKPTGSATQFDYTKAVQVHWLHDEWDANLASGIPESIKRPPENRQWIFYENEAPYHPNYPNGSAMPAKVGQVIGSDPDTSTVLTQATYNEQGHPTQTIDPEG